MQNQNTIETGMLIPGAHIDTMTGGLHPPTPEAPADQTAFDLEMARDFPGSSEGPIDTGPNYVRPPQQEALSAPTTPEAPEVIRRRRLGGFALRATGAAVSLVGLGMTIRAATRGDSEGMHNGLLLSTTGNLPNVIHGLGPAIRHFGRRRR